MLLLACRELESTGTEGFTHSRDFLENSSISITRENNHEDTSVHTFLEKIEEERENMNLF